MAARDSLLLSIWLTYRSWGTAEANPDPVHIREPVPLANCSPHLATSFLENSKLKSVKALKIYVHIYCNNMTAGKHIHKFYELPFFTFFNTDYYINAGIMTLIGEDGAISAPSSPITWWSPIHVLYSANRALFRSRAMAQVPPPTMEITQYEGYVKLW